MANHKIVNGEVVFFTEEEEAELLVMRAEEEAKAPDYAREKRDALLLSNVDPIVSNTLRLNDMSEDKRTEWTSYRQALLDIPEQSGFPNDITWPTKPE
jgi:hypothetical protein